MPKWLIVLLFVIGAAMSWGIYVPTIHKATGLVGSNLRAFLLVGMAYFLTAVLIPALLIFAFNWDPTAKANPNFDGIGVKWGLFAGTMGAVGALCVIFAVVNAGKGGAIYVAPLVFAGAPIINTIATLAYFHPVKTTPDWRFFAGLVLAIAGATMVMIFKPTEAKPHAASPHATAQDDVASPVR
ncbi:MAG: hypothetical protein WBC44_00875 [Planctomycetaceae bacterium]